MGSSQQLVKFYLKRDEHTYWTLPVDSGTTAKDIAFSIASKLEINPSLCYLCEAKLDKASVWEREIAPTEKILSVQSKWNPKKYAEKFVVVKPNKIVKKENRNSLPPAPVATTSTTENGEELKYIEESWREKAHSEIELLRREIQVLSETNAGLQQQLYEEKQKRNSMKNPGDVVKQLMEAEQKIDDLQVMVKEMNDQSNRLEVENADLFQELNQAARAIGGPYEEKISAIKRTPRKTTIQQPNNINNNSSSPSISSSSPPVNPRTYFEGNRSESPNYLIRKDNMTSADYDRNIEVASLGLDLAELQKSQRARERALEESKQRLREELEQSKQRRSDVLKESKQVLLEELESIKSKSDISKKKFEDSLLASRKKLEQELETIEKKRKAQEDVRWSRPMNGFSSTLSPSKQDGFSISPSSSPTPTRRELFTSSPSLSPSPSRFDDSINNNSNNNSPLSSSQLSYSSPKFSREGERKPFSLS